MFPGARCYTARQITAISSNFWHNCATLQARTLHSSSWKWKLKDLFFSPTKFRQRALGANQNETQQFYHHRAVRMLLPAAVNGDAHVGERWRRWKKIWFCVALCYIYITFSYSRAFLENCVAFFNLVLWAAGGWMGNFFIAAFPDRKLNRCWNVLLLSIGTVKVHPLPSEQFSWEATQ